MKGCVLEAVGQLIYKEVDAPRPKTGEVLLKTKAAGICGSDIERVFVKGTYHFPTIPGHEFSGEVVQVGEGVDTNLLGRRAAVFPLLPCRKCDMCEVGEYASCRNYNYFGSRCDGGFAEYVAIPVWNLIFGPDSLSYEVMAMAEPAAVSLHALSQGDVKLGDQVAVFGAGAIGLMIGELARIAGVDKVIMLDIEQKKLGFDFKEGGLVCTGCNKKKSGYGVSVSKGTLKQLFWISHTDIRRADRIKFSDYSIREGQALMEAFIPFHIGREFKSLKFLREIR